MTPDTQKPRRWCAGEASKRDASSTDRGTIRLPSQEVNSKAWTAQRMIAEGFGVIPVDPGLSKRPLWPLVKGVYCATHDPAKAFEWWKREPHANLGIALSGYLVIDIDPRNGGSAAAVQAMGPLLHSWRSQTGGGGYHLWYRLPEGAQVQQGGDKLARGIDIKSGPGSYVLAPPSQTSGRYRWLPDCAPWDGPIAEAPAWLLKALEPAPPPKPRPAPPPRTDDDQRIADALAKISADDRGVWLRVGMALKAHYGEDARALWDSWSATSSKYCPKGQAKAWKSFRGNGVGIGTVFHYARQYGRAA